MKIVILGKGTMLANLIQGALDAGVEIAGVFRYERTVFSPLKLFFYDFFTTSPDLTLIKQHKLHEIKCRSANSEAFRRELLRLNADVMFVGTWHEKIKKSVYDMPVIATINVHPSLLPAYRGPNPYLQTIKHLEKQSGVTFHLMDENFDKGAILSQKEIEIFPGDTGKELKDFLIQEYKEVNFVDLGTNTDESVDYPDYAKKVVKEVLAKNVDFGVLICGTGIGMSICANRNPKIRAGLCKNVKIQKGNKIIKK